MKFYRAMREEQLKRGNLVGPMRPFLETESRLCPRLHFIVHRFYADGSTYLHVLYR